MGSADFLIIVINAIKPYGYEIVNVLGLPTGFAYRCRYRSYWVKLGDAEPRLPSTDGLIVLRNFDTAEFVPIRRISVDIARRIGDILWVEYVLGEWVALSTDTQQRANQLRHFNQLMSAALGQEPNVPGTNLRTLVFLGADFAYPLSDGGSAPSSDDDRWGTIVEELQQIPLYHDIDFLKVVRVAGRDGRAVSVEGRRGYTIRNSEAHTVEVLQLTQAGGLGDSSVGSRRLLRLVVDEPQVLVSQDALAITGRYDIFQFRLRPHASHLPANVTLSLRIDPSVRYALDENIPAVTDASPLDNARAGRVIGPIPDMLLPARVVHGPSRRAVAWVRIAVAAIALLFYLFPGIAVQRFTSTGDQLVRAGETVSVEDRREADVSKGALVIVILLSSESLVAVARAIVGRG